eukprot:4939711-Prorocentrum_lima.AAC.1
MVGRGRVIASPIAHQQMTRKGFCRATATQSRPRHVVNATIASPTNDVPTAPISIPSIDMRSAVAIVYVDADS